MTRALVILALVTSGCTSIGPHSPDALKQVDFGPRHTIRICALLDDGISLEEAQQLLDRSWRDERERYQLDFEIVRAAPWLRPAFTVTPILRELLREPLVPPCDRLFGFLGRHAGDFVWGFFGLPEVHGAVNGATMTHGYAVARIASLQQLIAPPRAVLNHELHHLLGCDTHFDIARCYEQIARLKRAREQDDFFPAWDPLEQRIITSRDEVNQRIEVERHELENH